MPIWAASICAGMMAGMTFTCWSVALSLAAKQRTNEAATLTMLGSFCFAAGLYIWDRRCR